MTVYKVKLGDTVLDVDGLSGLIALVKEGRLGPEDPVFIPTTGRWHYARSVRQLREHFPGGGGELPPAKPAPAPPARAAVSEAPPNGEVVPLRRGRWSPEGTGVEVPVFTYEVDAEPPRSIRLGMMIAIGVVIGGLFSVYEIGYAHYFRDRAATMGAGGAIAPAVAPTRPAPAATTSRATATKFAVAATPRPARTPSPTPTPLAIDLTPLRARVVSTELTRVLRPDQLGNAMRSDFTRLAVPIHEVALSAQKGPRTSAVPFLMRIDYAPVGAGDRERRIRDHYVILAMAGRRMAELKLNVEALHVRTLAGGKAVSDVSVPPALAVKAFNGIATADEVAKAFEPASR